MLHNVYLAGVNQHVDIAPVDTIVQIPVPGLKQKLEKIADGSAKSKPSFKVPFSINGDCNSAVMSPSTGTKPNWTGIVGSLPHQALGYIFGETYRSACMISGSGSVIVRRVGATKKTSIPASIAQIFRP